MSQWWQQWDPDQVTLADDSPGDDWKTCVLQGVYFGENEYDGNMGGRISAIFVILVTSLIATLFPVVSMRVKWMRIPEIAYVIAKMFGSGVIVATAFIHLMDPAYASIGGNACVGMTGNWSSYPWCPAIMLASAVFIFIVDAYCDFFADIWYGIHSHLVDNIPGIQGSPVHPSVDHTHTHTDVEDCASSIVSAKEKLDESEISEPEKVDVEFYSQFAGFLILEFGVIFHSVMIGLTLGSSEEYRTLYPVLVFHQAFEGLGIGSRLSTIPFPKGKKWWPYVLSIAYSMTTPIAIAIGLGVRESYRDSGYTALIVQGVLDAISAGILLYTGFVELLARDFIFNPRRTKNIWMLNLQLFSFLWGAGLMALLGEWA